MCNGERVIIDQVLYKMTVTGTEYKNVALWSSSGPSFRHTRRMCWKPQAKPFTGKNAILLIIQDSILLLNSNASLNRKTQLGFFFFFSWSILLILHCDVAKDLGRYIAQNSMLCSFQIPIIHSWKSYFCFRLPRLQSSGGHKLFISLLTRF